MVNFAQASETNTKNLFEKLNTNSTGLLEEEAKQRLKTFGKNILPQRRATVWKLFLRQFKNTFLYLLIVASIISFFLGQGQQAVTILIIIFLTALLGFFLEFRSQKAEEKLSSFLQEFCWVKREEEKKKINKNDLVPGDLVLLQVGDIVPADCRLISKENLLVDESILTGESVPVEKIKDRLSKIKAILQAKNILFAGTTIQNGNAEAVVFATGVSTQVGKISRLVSHVSSRSSFEQTLKSVSNFILRLTLVALLVIFAANIGIKGLSSDISSFLLFVLALAIGIVPEALPVVSLFTMSLGALALTKKKVIVKRLTALEDLGNVQVLCVDKTGTLTENKLSIAKLFFHSQKDFWETFIAAVGPILGAKGKLRSYLDQVIYDYGIRQKIKPLKCQLIFEEPFQASLRRDRVLIKKGKRFFLITKGAPEIILQHCSFEIINEEKEKLNLKHWQQLLEQEGEKGRRTYAMAVKEIPQSSVKTKNQIKSLANLEKEMTFVGFVSFSDPIKKTAYPAIQKASNLGVIVKVLTGDSAPVAGWVAKEIGLIKSQNEVIKGEDLERMSQEKLRETVFNRSVFARVSPEQKFQIVKILQEKYWTAFLGDGFNDAPSLKLANVSLVVDKAAEAAKAVSDVILLKKDLQVILLGIEQGRKIFVNVLKYIQYTLASNFGNSYSLALISLFLPFLPMLPAQILLVNLLSDFPLIFVATDKVDPAQIRQPVSFDVRQSGFLIVFLGFISMIFDFIFFGIFRQQPSATLQTLWFIESVLSENIFILSIRSRLPFWQAVPPSLPLLGLIVVGSLLAVLFPYSFFGGNFNFARPSLYQIALVLAIVLIYFITTETVKIIYYLPQYKQKNKVGDV